MLIEEAVVGHQRVACLREIQNSIQDSSKQLLEDKIDALGVRSLFQSTDREIRGPNDSLLVFRGLQTHTAASIKSIERFTRAWVDEAHTISQKSLDILTPSFRAPGSELWFSWNPDKADDPIEKLFLENENDPDFILVRANYSDNPWFPAELRADMERDKRRDPDKYAHIWLGGYQRRSAAAVFRNWKIGTVDVPDAARPYFGADWGFSIDPTVLVRCWLLDGRTLYIDREVWQVGCEIDRTPGLFLKIADERVPNVRRWPIRADSARPETISFMQRQGWNITPAIKGAGSVEEGVAFLQSVDIIVHPDCTKAINELSMYSYKIDKRTDEVLPLLEDDNNHVIDALRYALEDARKRRPMLISDSVLEGSRMR
jgi:phage terminase large subunit